jgi:amidohydrolase
MDSVRNSDNSTRGLSKAAEWIDRQVAESHEELVSIRRHLHAHPEESLCEFETTSYLFRKLTDAGLAPRKCEDDRGIIVDVDVGTADPALPRVAVRADIDALRLTDRKDVEYKSTKDGMSHACGHDAHATVVLLVARLTHQIATEFETQHQPAGRFRFLFQPAEEVCEGARSLVRQGAMDGVGAILGLHVEPMLPAGMVGLRYGALTAHCDEILIRLNGRGGHAARPHHTTDPIGAAAQLITALYQTLPRTIDSREPAVFTVGRIAGGLAPNVIPDNVEIQGTLRTVDSNSRSAIRKRIGEVCHAIASMSGNDVTVEWVRELGAVRNDTHVTQVVHNVSRELIGDESILEIDKPSMGGEDFSVYLDYAPGCQIRLGCARPGVDWPLLHSPVFDIDERALGIGVRILTRSAFELAAGLVAITEEAETEKENHVDT